MLPRYHVAVAFPHFFTALLRCDGGTLKVALKQSAGDMPCMLEISNVYLSPFWRHAMCGKNVRNNNARILWRAVHKMPRRNNYHVVRIPLYCRLNSAYRRYSAGETAWHDWNQLYTTVVPVSVPYPRVPASGILPVLLAAAYRHYIGGTTIKQLLCDCV